MTMTREDMIKQLSAKSGYTMQDIRHLLHCMDTVVLENLCEVDDDNEIVIQLVQGIKVKAYVVPERNRVDPRNRNPIVVKATVKPMCKISEDYRLKLQEAYESKKNG